MFGLIETLDLSRILLAVKIRPKDGFVSKWVYNFWPATFINYFNPLRTTSSLHGWCMG